MDTNGRNKMTGKMLKKIRLKSGLTVKKFYEEKLKLSYYTIGLNIERFAEVPQDVIDRLKKNGFLEDK
jgi:hypothetical protein